MNINKKSRTELKTFFTRNAVPNQGNFEDLIDAPINQKDDGLTKQSGEPLSIEAGTNKAAVRLYESFSNTSTNPNPAWTVGLQDGATGPTGLTIADGSGTRRLFIDAKTGTTSVSGLIALGPTLAGGGLEVPAGQRLGVGGEAVIFGLLTAAGGVNLPAGQRLSVGGETSLLGPLTASGGLSVPAGKVLKVDGSLDSAGPVNARAGLSVSGAALNVGASGAPVVLNAFGTITANNGLSVNGGTLNLGNASNPVGLVGFGPIFANRGLSVPADQTLTCDGTLAAKVITASGPVEARAGLTVPENQTLTSRGTLAANVINASGPVEARAGLAVSGAPLRLGADVLSQTAGALKGRGGVRLTAGASQYVSLPSIGALPFNTGFLIQAWVYVYSISDFARIFDFGNGAGGDNILLHLYADGSLCFSVFNGGQQSFIRTPPLQVTVGSWVHIAVAQYTDPIDGLLSLIYVNTGRAVTGRLSAPATVVRNNNLIGRSNFPNNPFLNGIVSELSIFVGSQRVPNPNPLTGNEPGLVGYWKFNETSGTIAADSCTQSGRIGNATLQNGAAFATSGLYWDQAAQQLNVERLVCSQVSWGDLDSRTEFRDDAGAMGAGVRSGFYQTAKPVNFPANATNNNDWWHLIDCRHGNPTNNHALQIAGFFRDQSLWFRKTNNIATTGWSLISASPGSDASLKRDVVQLEGALEKLATVRGVSFNWIDESRGKDREIGVIAQEVEKVFPELVQIHGGHRYVRYELLTPVLIEAVKTLAAEVEALKRTLASMQGASALQAPAQG